MLHGAAARQPPRALDNPDPLRLVLSTVQVERQFFLSKRHLQVLQARLVTFEGAAHLPKRPARVAVLGSPLLQGGTSSNARCLSFMGKYCLFPWCYYTMIFKGRVLIITLFRKEHKILCLARNIIYVKTCRQLRSSIDVSNERITQSRHFLLNRFS